MTTSLKLRRAKKDPLPRVPRDINKLSSDIFWVYKWIWTLDPRASAADIQGYKKGILKPLKQILSAFNKVNRKEGPTYKLKPTWDKIKSERSLKLSVQIILVPTHRKGGSGDLTPPKPPQPPPPPL